MYDKKFDSKRNKVRYLMCDGVIKLSFSVLLIIFILAILGLVFDSGKVIENLCYSYIVTYLFYLLSIVIPRIYNLNKWRTIIVSRFVLLYEAWAMNYCLYHFYFRRGNSLAVQDSMVKYKANTQSVEGIDRSNRFEIAKNLEDSISKIGIFTTIYSNQIDNIPTKISVGLQEICANPIFADLSSIIAILYETKFNESNALNYINQDVRIIGLHFSNLQYVAKRLGIYKTLTQKAGTDEIFIINKNLINWLA